MESFIILKDTETARISTINTDCVEKYDVQAVGNTMQCVISLHLERVSFTTDAETSRVIGCAILYGCTCSYCNKEYNVTFN